MAAPRPLLLPDHVPGKVWLHSMPGRNEPFDQFVAWAADEGVGAVLCLNPQWELERGSRGYASALGDGTLPWRTLWYPISNMGTPDDPAEFAAMVADAAGMVRGGGRLVIHCAYGVGRTGMAAAALLMELGCGLDEACGLVNKAGSCAETGEQAQLIESIARARSRD